ncbi:hypothetical protein [Orenia marismortui]|uniref:hypothetical protein n=1 Tax=Orenia marismortui TaxID=46469 RepID=UPI00037CD316|nr:hypothetical protein [Orenia marismortui]
MSLLDAIIFTSVGILAILITIKTESYLTKVIIAVICGMVGAVIKILSKEIIVSFFSNSILINYELRWIIIVSIVVSIAILITEFQEHINHK